MLPVMISNALVCAISFLNYNNGRKKDMFAAGKNGCAEIIFLVTVLTKECFVK